jgi:hypothetical protein
LALVQRATELFHMDGKPHPGTLNPGVILVGRWISSTAIETSGTRDGQDKAHFDGTRAVTHRRMSAITASLPMSFSRS